MTGLARHRLAQQRRGATELGEADHLDQVSRLQGVGRSRVEPQAVGAIGHETLILPRAQELAGDLHPLESARIEIEKKEVRGLSGGSCEEIQGRLFLDTDSGAGHVHFAEVHPVGRPVPSHQQAPAHPDARVLETVQRPGFPAEEAQLDLALP